MPRYEVKLWRFDNKGVAKDELEAPDEMHAAAFFLAAYANGSPPADAAAIHSVDVRLLPDGPVVNIARETLDDWIHQNPGFADGMSPGE